MAKDFQKELNKLVKLVADRKNLEEANEGIIAFINLTIADLTSHFIQRAIDEHIEEHHQKKL